MTAAQMAFDPKSAGELPAVIPVFPLTGAVLLPRADLPLNIFEPRYLQMINDSLGNGRMFGMVQPSDNKDGMAPPLYETGCLGRITAFQETADGRMLVSLRGLCRFRIEEEMSSTTLYRQARVSYEPYEVDFSDADTVLPSRDALLPILRNYFDRQQMEVDWDCIEKAPCEKLVNYLTMICPLDACEKQVLLEAKSVVERGRLLMSLLQLGDDGRIDCGGGRLQ